MSCAETWATDKACLPGYLNHAFTTSMRLLLVNDITNVFPDGSRYGCATPAYTSPPSIGVAV